MSLTNGGFMRSLTMTLLFLGNSFSSEEPQRINPNKTESYALDLVAQLTDCDTQSGNLSGAGIQGKLSDAQFKM